MPESAWVEIRDLEGRLLDTLQAEIDGGSIRTWLPSFGHGSQGTLTLCTGRRDGSINRVHDDMPVDLDRASLWIVEMG